MSTQVFQRILRRSRVAAESRREELPRRVDHRLWLLEKTSPLEFPSPCTPRAPDGIARSSACNEPDEPVLPRLDQHLERRELDQRLGQGRQTVVSDGQVLELRELAQRLGQGRQLGVADVHVPERRELAQRLGQGRQLGGVGVQHLERREMAQRLGQGRQLVVADVQVLELRELAQRLGQGPP
jgi:hypothetical protein